MNAGCAGSTSQSKLPWCLVKLPSWLDLLLVLLLLMILTDGQRDELRAATRSD
jgi:hypothetical protein